MKAMDKAAFEEQNVFGNGAPNDAYAQYFVGHSFLNPLTDPKCGVFLANVTFEPDAVTTGTFIMHPMVAGRSWSARQGRAGTRRKENRQ